MNKKGFTLIELLAVIIILGILMIIAIPSVTKYISDSRKNAYVDTAKEIIGSARNLVNSGQFEMYDTNTTYYIDVACIKSENATKSPYGDFVQGGAYVVVTYDGKGYTYYWTSVDDAGQGIKDIVRFDKLDPDKIDSDLSPSDITTTRGIDGRENTVLIRMNSGTGTCTKDGSNPATSQVSGESGRESGPVCKKATTLHKITCERVGSGCDDTTGNGNEITYGTIPTGTPKAGDAYDCDVNNDGTYNSATERFYYIKSDGDNSILIYYANVNNQATYAYDSVNENWHGPRTGYQDLPSTTEWSNPGIIAPGTRQIVTENGNTSTSGGTIESFTYTNKAARLLTYQEVSSACGSGEMTNVGYLNNCTWLLENIDSFERPTGINGYWLETPRSSPYRIAWNVNAVNVRVSYTEIILSNGFGVRPVITIKTSDLE